MMSSIRETSQQERRVYVGNLAYDPEKYYLPMCSFSPTECRRIVEYATREQAQQAVAQLSNQNLMGRLVYDREAEPRFTGATSGNRGGFSGGIPGGFNNNNNNNNNNQGGYGAAASAGGRQIYVANLPFNAGWQDLKDLFRQAARSGSVFRADVHSGPDGRPKGSGIVVFENADDARNAIQQFNGYDWQGRMLEVREDRYASVGGVGFAGRGAFGGGLRAGFGGAFGRGSYSGGRGGFGMGGRGGFTGGATFDIAPTAVIPPNPFTDGATAGSEKSETIYVRNLPWSTSNDDLVDLFTTIGKVEQAEIQYEPSGRSKGSGVVRFDSSDTAETAIAKFQGYQYGGRPLNLSFVKYINHVGGDRMETDAHGGLTQDQIM
ncbi:related to Gbp2p [Claviceps purpurea 20.1]|uniref:Related to Gbp2p n=1 Tax=Claviceps purpurea (strain 20.1) TaxID=1111077 RepID=M1W6S7_CLAP2|nr:related to Gbp2p [Claviceps purpurea 20.1]